MTCEFFGFKPDADRGDLFNEKDLGKTVEITVIGFGEYRGENHISKYLPLLQYFFRFRLSQH